MPAVHDSAHRPPHSRGCGQQFSPVGAPPGSSGSNVDFVFFQLVQRLGQVAKRLLLRLVDIGHQDGHRLAGELHIVAHRPDLLRQELMYVSHLIQNIPHHRGI